MSLHRIYDGKRHVTRAEANEMGDDAAGYAHIVDILETAREQVAAAVKDMPNKDTTTLDQLDDILSDARAFRDEERRKYDAEMEKV